MEVNAHIAMMFEIRHSLKKPFNISTDIQWWAPIFLWCE